MNRSISHMSAAIVAVGLLLAPVFTGAATPSSPRRASTKTARAGPVRVWMRDVVLYPYDDAPAQIVELSGSAAPTSPGRLVTFDDVSSYNINVEHAEARLGAASLSVLMNRYILPASKGAIKHVDVSFGAGVLEMKGEMVKAGAPIPFQATAVASPNADGDMSIKISKMTVAGVVPKGLMDALGLKMSTVAQPHNTGVFYLVGDTMVLPLISMFPPPKFSGRLRSVTVTPQAMIVVIGAANPVAAPVHSNAFIHFQGGDLKFAKLTMHDVDLTLVPKSGVAPLGFSPSNYYRQMVAGYSVPQPDGGLVAHVPDYAGLKTK